MFDAANRDRLARLLCQLAAVSVSLVFFALLWNIAGAGVGKLSLEFLTGTPEQSGRAGGIAPILVSTLLLLMVCLATSAPLALATAILLSELGIRERAGIRFLRRSLDVLAAVPSIVMGLFGSAFFSVALGLGFSILAGGLTLSCMILPILIRSTEEGLRAVPPEQRLAAAAAGLSQTTTLRRVLLPLAFPGIVAGLLLGIGRAIGETAALIFTSGYVDRMPESLLDSGRSLSVHIYDLAMNVPGGNSAASASSLLLIALLLGLNLGGRIMARRWLGAR